MSRRFEDEYNEDIERDRYPRISQVPADEEPKDQESSTIGKVYNCQFARVWKAPSGSSAVMTVLEAGDTIRILKKIPGYYKVETSDGKVGYMASNYLKEV